MLRFDIAPVCANAYRFQATGSLWHRDPRWQGWLCPPAPPLGPPQAN